MLVLRLALAAGVVLGAAGCGYIHFGRLPAAATATGDSGLAEALSNLSTEHKILKQELLLARKEGDALRSALDRAGAGGGSDLAARLNETARELAALRASHAQLQGGRAAGAAPADAATRAQLAGIEEKLASSLRTQTQLQEENARLRAELDRARSENTALTARLETALTEKSHVEAAVAQLNTELLAQKEARARADQAAAGARAQLEIGRAASRGAGPPGEASAAGLSALQLARAPPAGASATAELRTSADRLRAAAANPAGTRIHLVTAGDTLESLARKYYGREDRAERIETANATVLQGRRDLVPGTRLTIPE